MPFQIDTIRPVELSADDHARWSGAIATGDKYSPLFHPDFVRLVAHTRRDVQIIRAEDRSGRLGFLPLHRRHFGFSRPIAAAFSDYHGVIREPGFDVEPEALLRAAGIRRYKYFGRIGPGLKPAGRGLRADCLDGKPTPFEHFETCHAKKAKQFRRLRRKLERERGAVELVLGDDRPESFDRLWAWKESQFRETGRHNVLRPLWAVEMMNRLHEGGQGEVSGFVASLTVNGEPIAAEFGPRWRGAFHPWIAAYDPAFAEYSPGHLLVAGLLEGMREAGLDRYDLGHDDGPYKATFANTSVALTAGAWRADGARESTFTLPGLAGQISRRWEQICLAETDAAGLLSGAATAAISLIRR